MRLLLLLSLALAATGCATVDLQPALADASDELQDVLVGPGQLMAAAALVHADGGAYPSDAYALLGSRSADRTGARGVRLSELALSPGGDTLRAVFVLAPSQADPTERVGGFALTEAGPGRYVADFRLDRRADQTGEALPLATTAAVEVERARGTLRIDASALTATLADRGAVPPPFEPGAGLTYTFTRAGSDREVGVVTLEPIQAD